ncbi:MAG: hypothetical protein FJZ16_04205 [Candidatus Omnitrophica bacterium]|nr:hypothetical protein [Candidatus Omnitrophota bacterium]
MTNFIKFCLVSIICLSILFPTNTFAVDSPSEPYFFIKDLIQVASLIHSSVDRFKTKGELLNETDEVYLTMQMMKGFRTAISDIEEAKIFLNKYLTSKNETIKESSQAMLVALGLLSNNYQDTIKYLETIYSPETMKNPDAGKMMSEGSKLTAGRDEILKLCMDASIMATYALVSDQPDKEGHLSYLTITSKERDDLKKELERYFGNGIKDGIKAGQSLSLSPASALYEFLKRDFTPADKR